MSYITYNRNSIFSITSRMHSHEKARNFEVTFIMETLHNQMRQIEYLQAECYALRNLVMGLVRNNTSANSNVGLAILSIVEEVKEDEIVQ